MSINYYLFAVAFSVVGASCIYICMRRVLSCFLTRNRKVIDKLNLAICSLMALGAVSLVTFAFFYLQNQQWIVFYIEFGKIGFSI